MRFFIFLLAIFTLSKNVYAAPDKGILDSCLAIEAITPSVHYFSFKPTDYYQEEDNGINSTTFMHQGREIGVWESTQKKNFGFIYNGRKIRQQDIIKIGSERPSTFDPAMAQWGIASKGKKRYICTAFNFEGLGQSGSFQNIRGIYVIDVESKPVKIYYMVGDARRVLK